MQPSQSTTRISWEYLMPKRKERMAGYIRESNPELMDSATMDSQAKAVLQYGQKEGYIYEDTQEYREAISAYTVPYMERPALLRLLEAAKRKEFDVLVVTEIRALSRRQVEVFVIYDLLQKYGVRLETISEKFEDSAMGRLILSLRSFVAEVERENTYMRMQRGRRDRLEAGNVNGHSKPLYGYVFIDTEREVKAHYALNLSVVLVTEDGIEWTEVMVVRFIFEQAVQGKSTYMIAMTLTRMGIPTPSHGKSRNGKPFFGYWHPSTIHSILTNRHYIGEVVGNKYIRVDNKIRKRPEEEQIRLPNIAPPIVSREVFDAVQEQLLVNKQDSKRNNKQPELGLLRAGYVRCGICARSMCVRDRRHQSIANARQPQYRCDQTTGKPECNHCNSIMVAILDVEVKKKIIEILHNPAQIRTRVGELREEFRQPIDTTAIEARLERIRAQMHNLYTLAQNATDDETIASLGKLMQDLEKQKRDANALLLKADEYETEQEKIEEELQRFEAWVNNVRPLLTNTGYTPTYEELRLAVRVLGIHVTVYPALPGYPYRYLIDLAPPKIMDVLHYTQDEQSSP